jgi:dethiobiotin synthetase
MKGFFITGTDTGVGKSVVAAALLCALRADGVDAVPMKPVETGCDPEDDGMSSDLGFCLRAAGLEPDDEELRWMAPYRFAPACSPHLAAERAGMRVSISKIADSCGRLSAAHDVVIVEGAGGILVPLDRSSTMLDLMTTLGLPVILVSRPGLGTINHTLLSLRQLEDAKLETAGVVFCETASAPHGFIEEDNRRTIEEMGGVAVLGNLPFDATAHEPATAAGLGESYLDSAGVSRFLAR